jgi:hypothetical protein
MAQLLPIVCKFFPCRMVGSLLCVYVHLNLALMMVALSGVADVFPGRDLGPKFTTRRSQPRSESSSPRKLSSSFVEYLN